MHTDHLFPYAMLTIEPHEAAYLAKALEDIDDVAERAAKVWRTPLDEHRMRAAAVAALMRHALQDWPRRLKPRQLADTFGPLLTREVFAIAFHDAITMAHKDFQRNIGEGKDADAARAALRCAANLREMFTERTNIPLRRSWNELKPAHAIAA